MSPANGAGVSGTVSIVTQIGSSVSWINIYIDGSYFASSPPSTFTWNSVSGSNGSHTISTLAFATGGAQLGSDAVTVTVTNGAPTPTPTATPTPIPAVKITGPANGASVSGTVNIVTQVSSSVSWINIYIDGNYFASSPPYTFSWNSISVPNGSHVISTIALDASDAQIGSDSRSVSVNN